MSSTHIISIHSEESTDPIALSHKLSVLGETEEQQASQLVSQIMSLNPMPRVGDKIIIISEPSLPLFEHICVQVFQRRFQETIEIRVRVSDDPTLYKIPYVPTFKERVLRDSPVVLYNYKDSCGSCRKC